MGSTMNVGMYISSFRSDCSFIFSHPRTYHGCHWHTSTSHGPNSLFFYFGNETSMQSPSEATERTLWQLAFLNVWATPTLQVLLNRGSRAILFGNQNLLFMKSEAERNSRAASTMASSRVIQKTDEVKCSVKCSRYRVEASFLHVVFLIASVRVSLEVRRNSVTHLAGYI